MTRIIGMDPGYSGAIAFIDTETGDLRVWDMPVLKDAQGKTLTNLPGLRDILMQVRQADLAVVEKVHAMPKQGVSSSFRFGENFGALQMGIIALGCPHHLAPPSVWKKHFKLSSKKDTSRGAAMRFFPESSDLFSRAKDDGRAEATLLAVYGAHNLSTLTAVAA